MIGEDEVVVLWVICCVGYFGCWVFGVDVKYLILVDRMMEDYVVRYFVG